MQKKINTKPPMSKNGELTAPSNQRHALIASKEAACKPTPVRKLHQRQSTMWDIACTCGLYALIMQYYPYSADVIHFTTSHHHSKIAMNLPMSCPRNRPSVGLHSG